MTKSVSRNETKSEGLDSSYLVKDIDGNIISSGISYKKLSLIEKRKGWIVDFKQF